MEAGETGLFSLGALFPVAEVHTIDFEGVTIHFRRMVEVGALEMN